MRQVEISRVFAPIRSKIRPSIISGVMREFMGVIGERYSIKAPTFEETFYIVPNLPNEILVSVKAMRVGLTFPLDPFMIAYFNAFCLTPIQLTPNL